MTRGHLFALFVSLLSLDGCSHSDLPLFKQLTPNQTVVTFANTIATNDTD